MLTGGLIRHVAEVRGPAVFWVAREIASRHESTLTVRRASDLKLVLERPHPRMRRVQFPRLPIASLK